MLDITKTFTIQWVGPFKNLQEMKIYLKDETTCQNSLFNFYYFSGNKKGKGCSISRVYAYLGIHKKADGIEQRLNNWHSHYKDFHENDNMRIWIGAFGNVNDQNEENIEDAETLFISTYGNNFLTENKKKVKANIQKSICIINLFYKTTEEPWLRKPADITFMDDVLIHETEDKIKRTLVAKLKSIKW